MKRRDKYKIVSPVHWGLLVVDFVVFTSCSAAGMWRFGFQLRWGTRSVTRGIATTDRSTMEFHWRKWRGTIASAVYDWRLWESFQFSILPPPTPNPLFSLHSPCVLTFLKMIVTYLAGSVNSEHVCAPCDGSVWLRVYVVASLLLMIVYKREQISSVCCT